MNKIPKLKKIVREDMLFAFKLLCERFGVKDLGFDVDAINAAEQWVIVHSKHGWSINCGLFGCGLPFGFAGYTGCIKNTRDFITALWWISSAPFHLLEKQ